MLNAPLSASHGFSTLASDPGYRELLDHFVRSIPGRLEAIEQAYAQQDPAGLARLAHQLRGAASGYGYPLLSDAARALEEAARAPQDRKVIRLHIARLAYLCCHVRTH
jgi:HPt (histidine-containing phosphotransfer) domain-containing protein